MQPYQLTIAEASDLLQARELSAEELTRSVLGRIEALDGEIGAYISVAADQALAAARRADEALSSGGAGPLTGIPLAVKDLICTRGVATTCASRILENFVPPYDAAVIEKLRQAGAVVVGKANMDEFAMGSTTENSGLQPTRNPWNAGHVPGGSSGGSAAAVAADMCLGALGSDTGGSIRQPASHCGVVGLKPTYGRVSRYGLVAFASSLDQIGPLAKSTRDCARLLGAISGHDRRDSTSVPEPVPDYETALDRNPGDLTVGIPVEFSLNDGLDPEVSAAVQAAVATIESLGFRCREVRLPHAQYAVAAYYVIAPSEASSNLARYDGVKYGFRDDGGGDLLEMYRRTRSRGFGAEVQRRIIIGTYCLSAGYYDAYYRKASQVRALIREDYTRAFESCDVILSPVAPTPAPAFGEIVDDPLTMYLSDIFTLSANLAGIPALSVPCGFSGAGLPIGLQLSAPHFGEQVLLQVAHRYEQAAGLQGRKPPLAG